MTGRPVVSQGGPGYDHADGRVLAERRHGAAAPAGAPAVRGALLGGALQPGVALQQQRPLQQRAGAAGQERLGGAGLQQHRRPQRRLLAGAPGAAAAQLADAGQVCAEQRRPALHHAAGGSMRAGAPRRRSASMTP